MKSAAPTLLLIVALAPLSRAQSSPEDFAWGYEVVLEEEAPIYRMTIPEQVYRGVVHEDLSDLRVFNSSGEPLPHTIRAQRPRVSGGAETVEIPFFPLPEPVDPEAPLSVRVDRGETGTIIRVAGAPARSATATAWLVDASQLDRLPDRLELAWEEAVEDFSGHARVEGSNDLVRWDVVVPAAPIARLDFEGNRLEKRTIDLPARDFDYLRLSWPARHSELRLSGITGRYRVGTDELERSWTTLDPHSDQDARVFVYERDVNAPIDRIGLTLPPGNVLLEAEIASHGGDERWSVRANASFYRVSSGGSTISNEEIAISPVRDDHWRVTVREPVQQPLRLRLGWLPAEIYFLARGEGPYTLAWGAGEIGEGPTSVAGLLSRVDDEVGVARATTLRELGGPSRLLRTDSSGRDRAILWSVLVIAALALGFVAWRLWREMATLEE